MDGAAERWPNNSNDLDSWNGTLYSRIVELNGQVVRGGRGIVLGDAVGLKLVTDGTQQDRTQMNMHIHRCCTIG